MKEDKKRPSHLETASQVGGFLDVPLPRIALNETLKS
jgi:hypothetical protein